VTGLLAYTAALEPDPRLELGIVDIDAFEKIPGVQGGYTVQISQVGPPDEALEFQDVNPHFI
jgi:hypothetical protein